MPALALAKTLNFGVSRATGIIIDALVTELNAQSGVAELPDDTKYGAIITFTGVPLNTETITINSRVYTWVSGTPSAQGEIKIGASAAACAATLAKAIMLTGVIPTDYGAGMTVNAHVTAVAAGAVVTIKSIIAGAGGNYAYSETATNAAFTPAGPSNLGNTGVLYPAATARNGTKTLTGNKRLATPTGVPAGSTGTLVLTQDGTGSRTVDFTADGNWRWAGGTDLVLSTAANAVDVLDWFTPDGVVFYVRGTALANAV